MTETTTHPVIAEWSDAWAWHPGTDTTPPDGRNAYHLASEADCGEPDRTDSPGALLLEQVRDGVLEAVEDAAPEDVDDVDRLDDAGALHEIADGAPDVYTHKRWAEFVDLAAYQEDLDELGGTPKDLTEAAGVALYIIADRLIGAMVADLRERFDDYEPDGDDDQDDETDVA